MSSKDLLNLGISPDSGTGDSARRGGEKINTLFADIYSNFGDNPVGNDPNGSNYGYRVRYGEDEFKVGELHPAGKFSLVTFKTSLSPVATDPTWGNGVDSNGDFVIADITSAIPDIYLDSEWYFLSRGEAINADLSGIVDSDSINFVLPLASKGDSILIRDLFDTWGNKTINVFTTPYEFQNTTQVTEWVAATGSVYPGSEAISVDGIVTPYKAVTSFDATNYPNLTQTYNGPGVQIVNKPGYELIFTFRGYGVGWKLTQRATDTIDVVAQINTINANIDSDLAVLNATRKNIDLLLTGADSDSLSIEELKRQVYELETIIDGGGFGP